MTTAEKEPTITLEQAKAVINAHREAEYVAKAAEARKLVGRYFKCRNSYGGDSEKWWLYAMPTEVDDVGTVRALSFQHTSSGSIEIRTSGDTVYIEGGGWKEITAVEFWKASSALLEAIASRMHPVVGAGA